MGTLSLLRQKVAASHHRHIPPKTSQLARSVEFYQRHVFLCYKNPQVWPSKIEASEIDQVPRLLFAAFKARKADMNKENYKFYPICKQSPKAIKTSVRHIEKKER